MRPLHFGFIATGTIARRMAKSIQSTTHCQLLAAASRSEENARRFANEFGVEAITGYEALLERDDVDAVYVATPHPQHLEWCLRAIEKGKHVLCEKPVTLSFADAAKLAEAAKERGVLVVEAFMYRFHPQTRKIVELVANGAIGELRWITADFGFANDYQPGSRLFAKSLGGGGILDIGCYTVSMARLIAGAAKGIPFLDPVETRAVGRLIPEEGTDWMAGALLDFPGDVVATVRCGVGFTAGNAVRIEGTKGILEINEPWFAGATGASIRLKAEGEETVFITEDPQDLYRYMLDNFAECVAEGKTESSYMSMADTLGNMRTLEDWYTQIGVSY